MENQNNLENNNLEENNEKISKNSDSNIVESNGIGKGNRWKKYIIKVVPFLLVGIIFFSLGFGIDRVIMKKRNKKLLRQKPGFNENIKKNQDKTPRDKGGKKST